MAITECEALLRTTYTKMYKCTFHIFRLTPPNGRDICITITTFLSERYTNEFKNTNCWEIQRIRIWEIWGTQQTSRSRNNKRTIQLIRFEEALHILHTTCYECTVSKNSSKRYMLKKYRDDAINYILDMSSDTYETILRQMAEKQRNTFLAICTSLARNVTGGIFAKEAYHLPSQVQ